MLWVPPRLRAPRSPSGPHWPPGLSPCCPGGLGSGHLALVSRWCGVLSAPSGTAKDRGLAVVRLAPWDPRSGPPGPQGWPRCPGLAPPGPQGWLCWPPPAPTAPSLLCPLSQSVSELLLPLRAPLSEEGTRILKLSPTWALPTQVALPGRVWPAAPTPPRPASAGGQTLASAPFPPPLSAPLLLLFPQELSASLPAPRPQTVPQAARRGPGLGHSRYRRPPRRVCPSHTCPQHTCVWATHTHHHTHNTHPILPNSCIRSHTHPNTCVHNTHTSTHPQHPTHPIHLPNTHTHLHTHMHGAFHNTQNKTSKQRPPSLACEAPTVNSNLPSLFPHEPQTPQMTLSGIT